MACETTKKIIEDLGDDFFCILVDETRDASTKEQMAIVLRYVNKDGFVLEKFLGTSHVANTKSLTLKGAIEAMLSKHGLSMSRIRGQGYDGASNMKGQINGLKSLILAENSSAYYIHCFAHQLQLALVAAARNHLEVGDFFKTVNAVINLIGASCKRSEFIRDIQATNERETGRGLNQEMALKRPGDTRWGSYYGALINLDSLFSAIIDVLETIQNDRTSEPETASDAWRISITLQDFSFVFILKLMIEVLAITNELSLALQRKDQDIVNAMKLVRVAKARLQEMRDNGWEPLLDDVISSCTRDTIPIPIMHALYILPGRSRRRAPEITNLHHFQVELFYKVVDMQLQELNNRFDEVNTRLLICMACFSPENAFAAFDQEKLLCLTRFYPAEFGSIHDTIIRQQLIGYYHDVMADERFVGLKGIDELSQVMVKTKVHQSYPSVYLLLKLVLILPIATASVERAFSALSYIKNKLRSRIGDQFANDCLVGYIEKDLLKSVTNVFCISFRI
ncbi:unnamed protein product [Linum tenue]|uniref:Zinc finger MYM-type protein 1-like n=1 Tax=Linum tenue TaxID=586396 RepID=A0AAV0RPU6_9ROSI|nr:unnamed protein product [Linum tenue]